MAITEPTKQAKKEEQEETVDFGTVVMILDEKKERSKYHEIKKVLSQRLRELPKTAYEDIGMTYYYLIRNSLNESGGIEDKMLLEDYKQLIENFNKREKFLVEQMNLNEDKDEVKYVSRKLQLHAFLKIAESYFLILEKLFRKKAFFDLMSSAYKRRMHYRKILYKCKKRYISWFGYEVWDLTSKYGESFFRWGLTSLLFIIFFSTIFYISGSFQQVPIDVNGNLILHEAASKDIAGYVNHPMIYVKGNHWFDYVYFSVVTIATVGYGDITPISQTDKALALIFIIIGYIMLGFFITLLAKKVNN